MTDKQYIGSGKEHDTFDSITVTLKMDAASGAMFTTDKGTFLRFVVTRRQAPDQYGKTHACFYVPKLPPAEQPKTSRGKKKGNLSQSA